MMLSVLKAIYTMADSEKKLDFIRNGIKTFFIVPDVTLIPEDYLEEYFSLGYECYIIDDDPYCPLSAKIEGIIAAFKDVILFFFIDRKIQGIEWPTYIRSLNKKYKSKVRIGVLYTKRSNSPDCRKLEYEYLWDSELICGCIPLEYQKKHNFLLIKKVLYANQANGRRKNIRAICGSSCYLNFVYNEYIFKAEIRDVSITHFSCVFTQKPCEIPLYEKIQNININIKGQHFNVIGVQALKRNLGEEELYVFLFRTNEDRNGLNQNIQEKMKTIIYEMTAEKTKDFLDKLFLSIRKRLKDKN